MLFILWIPLLLQVVVPLGLLIWLAIGRPRNRAGWLLRVVLVTGYLVAVAAGGMWLVIPWYTPLIFGLALLLAIAHSLPRSRLPAAPRQGSAALAVLLLTASLAAGAVGLAIYVLAGWRTPPNTVQLSFPLRGGTYLVLNGGGHELINSHLATLSGDRFRPWRGQSYGVDVVKVDELGLRAPGIRPRDPAVYAIFGEPLYAPCTGEVVAASDGAPEMPPPQKDRQHMAGNHVLLDCEGTWVLLGHMQKGSVRVRQGEKVATGQQIGRVGNTGNTDEPHLHIHAQRPGTAEAPLSGDPLPLRFGDRYPVRNARIRAQS
jgi:hypothetical protein